MDYETITIGDEYAEEEENTSTSTPRARRKAKLLLNGTTSSLIREDKVDLTRGQASSTFSSPSRDAQGVPSPRCLEDNAHFRTEAALEYSLTLIERRLEERRLVSRREGQGRNSMVSIFSFPQSLTGINHIAYQPELVSIGPYHRGKDHLLEFEEHKWCFLDKFLSRTRESRIGLGDYLGGLNALELNTRNSYSDSVLMSSHDFVEMMLLDGCFVLELLRLLTHSEDLIDEDDLILTRPWLIPILIRDLIKLENQLPFFVLDFLFESSGSHQEKIDPLPLLALKVFDLAFPRPLEVLERFTHHKGKHLLDLFHLSLLPSNGIISCRELEAYRPSDQSIQCVTQLRPSGIKFKPRKADSFLDINFRNRVLEIPSITVNDFTGTMLINCVALEQCQDKRSKYFTDYVSFMNCLINQPRDVAFLCADGIISRFSQDDLYVADLFNNLGRSVAFNIRNCYLAKQFREIESYYSSNWATFLRTYFSSPWAFISVISAVILLVLTLVQTVMSVVSFKCH